MNTKSYFKLIFLLALGLILSGCAKNFEEFNKKYNKPFKHNTPLIKKDMKAIGKAEIAKTLEMGPKPVDGKNINKKEEKITSETQRNYLLIPDQYRNLKQRITLRFKNLDFKETMKLMGKIGEINVLVGDEVAGAISAELIDVPWDKAFQALLDTEKLCI